MGGILKRKSYRSGPIAGQNGKNWGFIDPEQRVQTNLPGSRFRAGVIRGVAPPAKCACSRDSGTHWIGGRNRVHMLFPDCHRPIPESLPKAVESGNFFFNMRESLGKRPAN